MDVKVYSQFAHGEYIYRLENLTGGWACSCRCIALVVLRTIGEDTLVLIVDGGLEYGYRSGAISFLVQVCVCAIFLVLADSF